MEIFQMKLLALSVISSYELQTHIQNKERNHDMLSVNGFLVEVNEEIEYTSRLVLGCQTQGSRKKRTFLSYTEKKLGFRELQ